MTPQLFTGDDGQTAYLLTIWPDGTAEVAIRPVEGGTRASSTGGDQVAVLPAEVCS